MQLAPYPFNSDNPTLIQQIKMLQGQWGNMIRYPGSYPSKPKRMPERKEYRFCRADLQDHLKITTWWASKEARDGGYTCSAFVEYVGGAGYYATKGRAPGGGYCKESAAIAEALFKLGPNFELLGRLSGTGMSSIENVLKYLGWEND